MEINAIYEGDNLEVLSKFSDNSVDLIYADPPFFSNKQYEIIWKDGAEIRAFEDRWKGGIENYIAWMEPKIREMHRVLKDTGSMYLHCDWHADAHLRILMDKIFGYDNFQREIIWDLGNASGFKSRAKNWIRGHDTILFYSKGSNFIFKKSYIPYSEEDLKKYPQKKERKGLAITDVWKDIPPPQKWGKAKKDYLYPTQKPVALLERIINASSNKGDIVLDPFCGCGTALVAAQKLGRKWVGIDISPTACKLMKKRLQKEFGINAPIIRGNVDLNYVKKLNPFEFQNWVVVDKFLGTVTPKKSNDLGIDGYTPAVTGGYPIQVKQSWDVGRNVVDNFETALRRAGKKKGYIVAFSFGKGAYEEAARAKNEEGLEIILRTIDELLDGKVE